MGIFLKKPIKIQLVQELKPNGRPQCRIFGEWAFEKLAEDPLIYRKIVFREEAHFRLNGYVNKQNCRFWGEDHAEALQKLLMHSEKVTVWCGLWVSGIIGPHFFKDAANRNVTVNGVRYGEIIFNFFFCPKCKSLTCGRCDFNTTVPHAAQHT